MRFSVRRRYRLGRPLDERAYSNSPPVLGEMRIAWIHHQERRRNFCFAELKPTDTSIGEELIPALFEPAIVGMVGDKFSLSGIEHVDGGEYAQVWIVMLAGID